MDDFYVIHSISFATRYLTYLYDSFYRQCHHMYTMPVFFFFSFFVSSVEDAARFTEGFASPRSLLGPYMIKSSL
jgi:hypothetical protein